MKTKHNLILICLILSAIVSTVNAETPTIKVLAIGNSFSVDAVEQSLYELGAAAGVNFVIGNLYISGAPLSLHDKNAKGNLPAYSFRKIVDGVMTVEDGKTLDYCIKNDDWEYISFQQNPAYSGIYSAFFPYINDLLVYVGERVTHPNVKYMLHQTWANAANSTHGGFDRYNRDQMTMYNAIVDANVRVKRDVPEISIIIPVGTAVQNGRTSEIGDNFCRDGYHLDLLIGRYTAACTWFEQLTGINVVGNTAAPAGLNEFKISVAQNAAHLAVVTPNAVTAMAPPKPTANYYVKTTGSPANDGASWETPLTLDGALALANNANDDVIHIAAGTYTPTTLVVSSSTGLTDRDKTFEIYKNMTIIGGYSADATTGATPDPENNKTILSGDLGGGVNVHHVLLVSAPQIIGEKVSVSGITIKDGNANGTGGVIAVKNGATLLRNSAGGVYVSSTAEFTDCDIIDNKAAEGAGLMTILTANITLKRCNVERNNASSKGGGMYVWGTRSGPDPVVCTIVDCNISNNEGRSTGSGLYPIFNLRLYVYNTTISNNTTGGSGAGLYVREGVEGYIVNSTIHGNTSGSGRAGMHIYGTKTLSTSFDIISTTITANKGVSNGGLDVGAYTTSNIYNSIISGNNDASMEFNTNNNFTLQNSIVSDAIYDNTGTIVSNVFFDKVTMDALVFNKPEHLTKTCLINQTSGNDNPALAGYGMTVSALETLADNYIPAISSKLITTDQVGASRNGLTVIGAYVNPILSSTSSVKDKSFYVVSQFGLLTVVPNTSDQLSIYSISGVKLLDKMIVDRVDVSLAAGVYLVKVGSEVTRALVR